MKKRKLFWIVFPPFSIFILLSTIFIYYWSSQSYRQFYIDHEKDILSRTLPVIIEHQPELKAETFNHLQKFCYDWSNQFDVRLTLIDLNGKVLGDSHENPIRMDNHRTRPEIIQAIKEEKGTSIRFSNTLKQEMIYVAHTSEGSGTSSIVFRLAKPLSEIDSQLRKMKGDNLWILIIILFIVFLFTLFLSKTISQPLIHMQLGVEKMAKGQLQERLHSQGSLEMQYLAEAINTMASELNEKINTVIKQKNEQQAAFASMKEGVIALDAEGRLIEMNESAKHFLECEHIEAKGRKLEEVVRNSAFIALQQKVSLIDELQEDIEVLEPEHKIFQVKGTRIINHDQETLGTLFVINDMTQLRKLELMRTQFVANVSHELKTPLTSIKGYVETMIDSIQINDETVSRFLSKISHNANRLNALIEDLLTLSRVEQEGLDPEEIELVNIYRTFETVINELNPNKPESIQLKIDCDSQLKWRVHPLLFHQAVFNLVDNAVKHSNKEGAVTLKASETKHSLCIEIKDEGQGIDTKHIPHLLERFYRVDKARSRGKGGTGLGLSIVKHIVQAHQGRVEIESKLGQGSSFLIHLPNTNLI